MELRGGIGIGRRKEGRKEPTRAGLSVSLDERKVSPPPNYSTEKTFGPLDVLVNNAGYAQEYFRYAAPHDPAQDGLYKHPTSDWKRQIAINQEGVYFGMREGSGSMVKNKNPDGKSIINVSSAAALQGGGSGIGYNASKWAG